MSNPQTHIGSVVGTGADLNVVIGFQPDYVLVINETTRNKLEFFRGAAGSFATTAADGVIANDADGILALDSATSGEGFTIDAAAAVNVNGNTLRFFATRSGPGAN